MAGNEGKIQGIRWLEPEWQETGRNAKINRIETGIVAIISIIFLIQYVVVAVGGHGNYPEITCYSQLPGLGSGSRALHHFF